MRGGRILWGQIAVVFTIVLVMVWAATQWTAFRLGFQPQLGAPWFELAGWPVYYPPAFFWWWFSFDAYAPAIFVEGGIIEATTNVCTHNLKAKLDKLGIPADWNLRPTGTHSWNYWIDDLDNSWPTFARALDV